MIFPKSMEGRYCTFLLQGIPACEVKVRHVLADEIVATYQDDAEVHINPVMLVAWWPDTGRELRHERAIKAGKAKAAKKTLEVPKNETSESEATITPNAPKDVSGASKTRLQVKHKG
jgi:hypothetical protein